MPTSDAAQVAGSLSELPPQPHHQQHYLSDVEILRAPSPTKLSDGGHNMRRRYKAHRLSKKRSVHDYLTYTDDGGDSTTELQTWSSSHLNVSSPIKQRSVSLTTLNNSISQINGSSSTMLQPRMAQLETLEAKMASIEVSLSSSSLAPATSVVRRTKRMAPSPTPRTAPSPVSMLSMRSIPPQPNRIEVVPLPRDSDPIQNSLSDKENAIQSLKSKLGPAGFSSLSKGISLRLESKTLSPVSPAEQKVLETRVGKLRQDIEAKRIAVKNLKSTLDQLDITDNIDVWIRQAEVEFQLGREELNLMSLTEELQNLTTRLEIGTPPVIPQVTNHPVSLFGVVSQCAPNSGKTQATLIPFSVLYDPVNPCFGVSEHLLPSGVATVDWAREDCGLKPNDRIIEANGQMLLMMKQEALLAVIKSPALAQVRLVVLRCSPIASSQKPVQPDNRQTELLKEMEWNHKAALDCTKHERDQLRSENLRLSHRISYLEEQVSDLLTETPHTPSLPVAAQASPMGRVKSEVHVFQKGSHTTKIVSNGREIAVVAAAGRSSEPPRPHVAQRPDRGGRWEPEDSDNRSTRSLDVSKMKPAPPKKPQRLSLLRTVSLQQGIDAETGGPSPSPRKPSKRPHKNVVVVKGPEPSAQWIPAGAQYHNHRASSFDARGENWC